MHKEYFIWMLGVALVIAVAYGYMHQRNIPERYNEFRQNEVLLEQVKQEIDALRERVEQARAKVKDLETDPVEIEAAIRRVRRLTRDGEIVYQIEDPPPPLSPPAIPPSPEMPAPAEATPESAGEINP